MSAAGREDGQAAVEVALVLPLVALLALALLQVALIVRDPVLVVHAAREGARAAAVSDRPGAASEGARRSSRLDPARLSVVAEPAGQRQRGSVVRVAVRYRSATDVPLIGRLVGDVELRSAAAMRVE
jgi:Flp pilus assembly protein TadG